MTPLSLIKLNDFFIIKAEKIERNVSRTLFRMGLRPNKKFKVYSRNFCGGVVVGDEFFKIAFDARLAKSLIVSEVK